MNFIDDFNELNQLKESDFKILLNEFKVNPLNTVSSVAKFEKLCKDSSIDLKLAKLFLRILTTICDFIIEKKNMVCPPHQVGEKNDFTIPGEPWRAGRRDCRHCRL